MAPDMHRFFLSLTSKNPISVTTPPPKLGQLKCILCFLLFFAFSGCDDEEMDSLDKAPQYLVAAGDQSLSVKAQDNNVQVIKVQVLTADSTAKAGVNVFFTVEEGTATLTEPSVLTGEDGIASVEVTLGSVAEQVTIRAHVPGLHGSPLYFNFYITEGEPASIEVISGNFQEAPGGTTLADELWVKVSDQFGNPARYAQVTFALATGTGNFLWNTTSTDSEGKAYNRFTVGSTDPLNIITVTAGGAQTEFTEYTLVPVTLNEATSAPDYVFLSWTQNVNPTFSDYTVYRSPSNTYNFQAIATITDPASNFFKDFTASTGKRYAYYVKVTTMQGNSVAGNQKSGERGEYIDLRGEWYASDIAINKDKSIIYVANRMDKNILLIDTETFMKKDSISLPLSPNRIALSADETKMYVTVYGAGRFLVVDLQSKTVIHDIDISTELNATSMGDIYQTADGQLFASGYEGYIVKIDEANNFSAKRVASGESFFAGMARFVGDHDNFLYAEESYLSPNSLFKLDLADPDVPIVLEDEHGSVGNTKNAVLAPDGQYIYSGGQILSTSDFNTEGEVPGSVYGIQVSQVTDHLFACVYGGSFENSSELNIINRTTLIIEKRIPLGFASEQIFLSHDDGFAFLVMKSEYPQYLTRIYKINLSL
jgi:hypothetical protein